MKDTDVTNWRKSTYSSNGGATCVEVADHGSRVLVRDTQDRQGSTLAFSPATWRRFADQVKRSLPFAVGAALTTVTGSRLTVGRRSEWICGCDREPTRWIDRIDVGLGQTAYIRVSATTFWRRPEEAGTRERRGTSGA
jgi:hypothetical protein